MNVFELIRSVLDEAYEDADGTDDEIDAAVTARRAQLRRDYGSIGRRQPEPIDYTDPITRMAYVSCYVTSHANLVYQIAKKVPALQILLGDGDGLVQVACLGGGPGSDFLGLLKYVTSNDSGKKLKCFMLDRDPAWSETWNDVDVKLGAIPFSMSAEALDVTDPESWKGRKKFLKADLFTMVYFMSEVMPMREQAEPFFKHVLAGARQGSLVLFIDNNTAKFYEWFDGLASTGWKTIKGGRSTFTMPPDEDKATLGRYYEKFGPPKLRADIAWRVCRKL